MVLRSAVGAGLVAGAGLLEVVVLLLQAPSPMTAAAAIAVIAMARDFMIPPQVEITLSASGNEHERRYPIGSVCCSESLGRARHPFEISSGPCVSCAIRVNHGEIMDSRFRPQISAIPID
jgi:hypothetical protein